MTRTIVATDDRRIVDALQPFGTTCVMTSARHESGTDRVAEVARSLDDDIIVNVQGDEPEIAPDTIDALIELLLRAPDEQMATAATFWPKGADPRDPNLVKVIPSKADHAIYFSRSPIPYPRDRDDRWEAGIFFHLHQGIYAYRRQFLIAFSELPQGVLERTEKLEQLRALEHEHKILLFVTETPVHGIDTPEQYKAFVERVTNRTS